MFLARRYAGAMVDSILLVAVGHEVDHKLSSRA